MNEHTNRFELSDEQLAALRLALVAFHLSRVGAFQNAGQVAAFRQACLVLGVPEYRDPIFSRRAAEKQEGDRQ